MNNIIVALIIAAAYLIWVFGYRVITGDFNKSTPEEDPKITSNMGVLPSEEDLPGWPEFREFPIKAEDKAELDETE